MVWSLGSFNLDPVDVGFESFELRIPEDLEHLLMLFTVLSITVETITYGLN